MVIFSVSPCSWSFLTGCHGIGTGRLHATPGPILKMNLTANRMLQGTNPPVLIAANMLGIGAENPTHQIHMLAAK